ncbi:MAG TPA: MFS transporter [Mobilitalea sp.]|nr:MFS transporter [Mobilitalea sp.]
MKLNYKRTFFVGLAFLSIISFWELYDSVVPKILDSTFNLGETATGVVMALDNVLALFLLPLIGAFSDRVNTRFGKRMPFIVGGTALAVVFIILMPIAERIGSLFLFLAALGVVLIAMGLYRSPAVALMPDITPKPLRSKANAIINLMGTLGGIYTFVIIKFIYTEDGKNNMVVFISVAGLMVLAVVLLVLTIKEKKLTLLLKQEGDEIENEVIEKEESADIEERNRNQIAYMADEESETAPIKSGGMPKDVKKSFIYIMSSIFLWFFAYNAVKTAFSRYAVKVWGLQDGQFADPLMVALITALLSYIPIGIISSKIGRKKTIIGGIILVTLSYICGFMIRDYSPIINVIFAFTGIGWAAINVNSYPMVVEMCQGSDTGKFTGYYYTFSMAAQSITPILSGFLLENVSYHTLFPYAILFSVASFCTMLFVKHGDSKPMKKANIIENFDTDD